MAHIKKGNERRYKAAVAHKAALAKIDPILLQTVGAPIDHAAKGRKDHKPKVPPRIFEQQKGL